VLANVTNDYSGNTYIGTNGPGYYAPGTQALLKLGASGVIPNGSGIGNVFISGAYNGILDLAGFTQTINGLSGDGTVDNSAGNGSLSVGNNNQSSTFSGVIQDTASVATLLGLVSARERTTNYGASRAGLQDGGAPLVIYTSAQAHSSVEKAALLAGFGRQFVRSLPLDTEFRLQVSALEAAIAADRAAGLRPCAIVATSGTTATTAMDPIAAIAAIAQREGIWLHVDAAMGGTAMLLPECRHHWSGIETADSIVVNPHKWMTVAFDCTLYLVRDPVHLVRVMSTNPSFLQTPMDAQVRNYRDWGIALGRRFRALKIWVTLREQGLAAIRVRLRRDLANAQWLAAQVDATPSWRRIAPVTLQTVCVRHEPPGLSGDALDAHTRRWAQAINDSGAAYLTPAVVDGRWMVRVSIGIESTEARHVAELWQSMCAAAAAPATDSAAGS
jgi:aromatic-L-amino-acid decarboxylase